MGKGLLKSTLVLALLLMCWLSQGYAQGKIHILDKWHPMVHGFDAKDPVTLNVNPGDTLIAECRAITDPSGRYFGPKTTLEEFRQVSWPGHALFGPIYVEGAEPGDLLEVKILDLKPSPWAMTWRRPGGGFLPEEFKADYLRHYHNINVDKRILHFSEGIEVPIAPFMGVMAVAPPPEEGRLRTREPRRYGGNMD